jgi:hypothetical protein
MGVIGSTLFLDDGMKSHYSYTIGSSAWIALPNTDHGDVLSLFRASPPNYFVQTPSSAVSTANTIKFTWYNVSNSAVTTFSESIIDFSSSTGTLSLQAPFFAYSDKVYWIQTVQDASSNILSSSGLYAASTASASARLQMAGGTDILSMQIADANPISILLLDSSGYLYHVPLAGLGQTPPSSMNVLTTSNVTEDTNGVYWMDTLGTLYRCGAGNCSRTTVTLASGQGAITGFYQDDTALYWGRTSPNVVMRLAK